MGRRVRAKITLIGEANYVPSMGEPVQLHVANGPWRSGFVCSGGHVDDKVWVSTAEEWSAAQREGRYPAGDLWPITELAAI